MSATLFQNATIVDGQSEEAREGLNVLVENGAITGIIDWGDITAGDVATDLAAIWMLFADHGARLQAFAAYGKVAEATRLRARGWAIVFGVVLLDTGLIDHPRHRAMGERILAQVSQNA